MKTKFNYKALFTALCLAGATLMTAAITPAYAGTGVADNGLFELDGNPQDPGGAALPDDWATPPTKDVNNALIFTGIIKDPAPQSIFDGGKKDIQDIAQWSWKDGSVPDKDNLTNAYAAAYGYNDDLILYFGADRFANVGDAFMGFWFFQKKVEALPDGTFKGEHTIGDTLVLVDYPQGSNAVPYIAVVTWDPTCARADSNDPTPGDCAAANLRLKTESSGLTGAICGTTANMDACAITNHGNIDAPWAYIPKSGTDNVFPYESFFEGGINLSELIGNTACFSSFMAETRSSSSFTASLKDFVLGSFETCGISITKTCPSSGINATEDAFTYNFNGVVTNTGFGTLYDVEIMDDAGTTDPTDDFKVPLAGGVTTVTKGSPVTYSGSFDSLLNPPTNGVTVIAASYLGGPQTITATADTHLPEDMCPGVNRDPRIDVTKACSTRVLSENNNLVIKVEYSGQVCNGTGGSSGLAPISLNNVVVQDNAGTADISDDPAPILIGSLAAGACSPYSGSYYPASANSQIPAEISFSDTVTATGVAALGFGTPEDSATATCRLCPTCECPPL
ncbi:hypothetical protein [Tolumonas auensis]|uniref:hypothetical protein n=1 Tax=Tolumonas auensis TaxID=43948 RepID=UPI002AA7B5A5|nr:hypothetical protein [Tolumonas auensis]